MLLLAAAALASASLPDTRPREAVAPAVQAQATVRIVSGVVLRLGQHSRAEGQQFRMTKVSTADGVQPARLVEFE